MEGTASSVKTYCSHRCVGVGVARGMRFARPMADVGAICFSVLDFGFGFAKAVNMVVGSLLVSTTVFVYVIDMAALGGQKCNYTLGGTQQLLFGFSVAVGMPFARRMFARGYRPSRKIFSLADSNQEVEEYRVVPAAGGHFF